jgi:hypothetical protein
MSTASATALAATMLDDEAWDDLLELHRGTGVSATDSGNVVYVFLAAKALHFTHRSPRFAKATRAKPR